MIYDRSMRITTCFLAILAGVCVATPPASAATDQELYRSADLRIYRAMARDGGAAVVLTNLDEEGHRLGGEVEEDLCPSPPPAPALPAVVALPPAAVEPPTAEVRDRGPSGTTIVININTPPPAPAGPDGFAPAAYPVVFPGGFFAVLPGAVRYPSHLPFLGYGLDISSPGWFGGLGLNAGNRFGLKTWSDCGRGYDCMFGPR